MTLTKTKQKKPDFLVKESKFCSGVKSRWRFPRGKHSPVRQFHKGRPAMPTPGYSSPKSVSGMDKSGLFPVNVSRISDLDKIDSKTQGVIISGKVGSKKRLELLNIAKDKNLSVLNHKIEDSIKSITKYLEEKKKASKERKNKKLKAVASKETKKKEAKKEEKKSQTPKSEEKPIKETPKKEEALTGDKK